MKTKFELRFTKEFLRKLRQLRQLRTLEEKPFAGKRLTGRLTELFSLRIGDYRIIYQLSENKVTIKQSVTEGQSTNDRYSISQLENNIPN